MFSLDFLDAIRAEELEVFESVLPRTGRILELGGGTGQQASMLAKHGFDVVSVDVETSDYRDHRVYPVMEYDGVNLPFADNSFDVVFSSNVLEHVTDLRSLLREIARVLRPEGICVHAMPTHSWRIWTSAAHYLDLAQRLANLIPTMLPRRYRVAAILLTPLRGAANLARAAVNGLVPARHGERGNVLSEIYYFHPAWWRREFASNGYHIVKDRPMGLFYTGYMVLGAHMGFGARRRVCKLLGSACHLFVVVPEARQGAAAVGGRR